MNKLYLVIAVLVGTAFFVGYAQTSAAQFSIQSNVGEASRVGGHCVAGGGMDRCCDRLCAESASGTSLDCQDTGQNGTLCSTCTFNDQCGGTWSAQVCSQTQDNEHEATQRAIARCEA